jgi:hypothetical protein
MSNTIHYKLKENKTWEHITFEGAAVSVLELKQAIVNKDFKGKIEGDLLISNSQTGEVYRSDGYLVPRNTSVSVKRNPGKNLDMSKAPPNAAGVAKGIVRTAEDEQMLKVLNKANTGDVAGGNQFRRDYICNRCKQPGHHIKDVSFL